MMFNVKIVCFLLSANIFLINCNKSSSSKQWNKTIFYSNNRTFELNSDESESEECNVKIDENKTNNLAMQTLTNLMLSQAPPLDFSRVPNISPMCHQQSEIYIQQLKKLQMWALKLYDATAKYPSGILNGNTNQFGDFDMCLSAVDSISNISGRYCLASLQIDATPLTPSIVKLLHKLSHAHHHFKSSLDDPEHRVPQFASTKWAVCVPSGCTAKDVEIGLKERFSPALKSIGLHLSIRIKSEMCQTHHEQQFSSDYDIATTLARCVFVAFLVLALVATFSDYYAIGTKNQAILSFSLYKNSKALINIKRPRDDIEAIHGIRCLNAILLIFAHKSMALFFLPFANRTEMVEVLAQSWSVVARAASLYTDPFIMISGTLTAYSIFGKLKKNGQIHFVEEYVSRLLRILPTFAALIAFCTFVLPSLSNGPLWNLVVTHHAGICRQNWWRNLLFIHNYYGFRDMCLTHTHHVGIDTELFFISPILIILLWKWPKKGALTLVALGALSTILRYYVTYTMKLSNYVYFGTSIKQLFATADNMYILPIHRLTVYIMGIFLGYILRNHRNMKLSKIHLRIGNAAALLSFGISFWGNAFMGNINYKYKEIDAAWYAAFSPILWCFTFAWIIFTTHIGYRGFMGRMFSAPIFSYWTKISYTVYLTQFPVFFFNVGRARTSDHYNFIEKMCNFNEFAEILAASIALHLLFEAPFQNIKNVIFNNRDKVKCSMMANNNNDCEDIRRKIK